MNTFFSFHAFHWNIIFGISYSDYIAEIENSRNTLIQLDRYSKNKAKFGRGIYLYLQLWNWKNILILFLLFFFLLFTISHESGLDPQSATFAFILLENLFLYCQQGETYWKRLQLICNLPTCRLSESIRLKLNTFENEYVYERTRIYIYFVNFPKSNLNCISRGKISPFRFASSNRLASTRAQKKGKRNARKNKWKIYFLLISLATWPKNKRIKREKEREKSSIERSKRGGAPFKHRARWFNCVVTARLFAVPKQASNRQGTRATFADVYPSFQMLSHSH